MMTTAAAALLLFHTAAASGHHSCYYYVNFDPAGPRCGGAKGSSATAIAKCIACATAAMPKEPPSYVNCTAKLINEACRGVLPGPTHPPGPPSPPAPGQMTLNLLHEAAASSGTVCLDGSPGGYYWREGTGADHIKFLLVFNGGGWCVGV